MKASKKTRTDGMAASPFAFASLLFGNRRREEKSLLNAAADSGLDVEESRAYTLLSIDHLNSNTDLPSYRIAVRSDGTVIFQGRKNTGVTGTHQFFICQDTVEKLRMLFLGNRFSEIEKLPTYFYLPYTSTSFREDSDSYIVSRIDYNEKPARLIGLRQEAEDLLMISRFINKKTTHTIQSDQARV
jgi:hypothetical protein